VWIVKRVYILFAYLIKFKLSRSFGNIGIEVSFITETFNILRKKIGSIFILRKIVFIFVAK
jgi:hypothetical protein